MKSVPIFSVNNSYELFIQKNKNSKNVFMNNLDRMRSYELQKKKDSEEQFIAFLQELGSEFTEEEIEFIKANWTPPK